MSNLLRVFTCTVALALAATAHAQTFKVDPVHSMVVFRIQHLGVSYVHGRFNEPVGAFVVNDDPAKMSFDVQVEAAKIDTAHGKRDEHLRSGDFFDAQKHPAIHFKSTAVKKGARENEYEVTGDMSLRGVTKPVTVTLQKVGMAKGPDGKQRAGFESTFTVKRSDYGMTYGIEKGMIGDEVRLTVSLEGIEQGQ